MVAPKVDGIFDGERDREGKAVDCELAEAALEDGRDVSVMVTESCEQGRTECQRSCPQ